MGCFTFDETGWDVYRDVVGADVSRNYDLDPDNCTLTPNTEVSNAVAWMDMYCASGGLRHYGLKASRIDDTLVAYIAAPVWAALHLLTCGRFGRPMRVEDWR